MHLKARSLFAFYITLKWCMAINDSWNIKKNCPEIDVFLTLPLNFESLEYSENVNIIDQILIVLQNHTFIILREAEII